MAGWQGERSGRAMGDAEAARRGKDILKRLADMPDA